jgi:hypothetical protein
MILAAALLLVTGSALAGPAIDGKQDLMCEPKHLAQCDTDALCATIAVEDVELPPQLRVSFKQKLLSAPDSDRTSPIRSVEIDPEVVVLQGSQNRRGWSMVIDRATGALSGSIADAQGAIMVAGICTVP